MNKYVPSRIINGHTHYHPGELEQVAERWKAAGLTRTCVCAWREPNNPEVMACYKRFPELVVPFGYINLFKPDPDDVDRRRDEGFFGLKFITTPVPFSHESLMPIYERAAKYNMPTIWHTGWVAGDRSIRSLNMHPSELEPIARAFPNLKIMAAHLGNWWAEDAVGIMQHHANVYFDLSGGFIRKLAPSKLRSLFLRQPDKNLRTLDEVVDYGLFKKIVFATDNPPLEELLEFYVNLMNWLAVPIDIQDMVYYDNMAAMLGMDKDQPAQAAS
jgi:predicted TIM-barrel fold metal-dependent hydrolase